MINILCLEDCDDAIELVKTALCGYSLTFAKSVAEAKSLILQNTYSLLLVDIEVPDGTGLELVADLPEEVKALPIIFLTGKSDFASKCSAFSLGADDFIQKPYDLREMKLRVEARLRKYSILSKDGSDIVIGQVTCASQEQRLYVNPGNRKIDLTSHEFRLFRLLASAKSRIYSREEILNRIWSDSVAVVNRTVDVHISNLRKKLNGTGVMIETVIGVGYRLVEVNGGHLVNSRKQNADSVQIGITAGNLI